MFDQHAKGDNKEKDGSAGVIVNHEQLGHSVLIFLTSVWQTKASTSF